MENLSANEIGRLPEFLQKEVKSPEELDVLSGQSAVYGDLSFKFKPEYVEQLKKHLKESNAFQEIVRTEKGELAGYIAASESLSQAIGIS
jgi:hypothetical protein